MLRIQAEFVEGFGALADLAPPSASSAPRAPRPTTRSTPRAWSSAAARRAGFAVITGGGPARWRRPTGRGGGRRALLGLGIELPFEQGLDEWVDIGIDFRYFFAGKTMFVKYCQGFVCLAGGFAP